MSTNRDQEIVKNKVRRLRQGKEFLHQKKKHINRREKWPTYFRNSSFLLRQTAAFVLCREPYNRKVFNASDHCRIDERGTKQTRCHCHRVDQGCSWIIFCYYPSASYWLSRDWFRFNHPQSEGTETTTRPSENAFQLQTRPRTLKSDLGLETKTSLKYDNANSN